MELDRKIKTNLQNLTSLENDILYYILKNKENIINMTITKLAELNSVSVSMINKTLNKIGIAGFKELKITLAQDSFFSNSIKDKNLDLELEANIFLNSIIETAKNITTKQLDLISQKIEASDQTIILGEGFMQYVAKDFYHKLNKISKTSKTIIDVESSKYIDFSRKSVLFVLSVSGSTQTLKKIITILRNKMEHLEVIAVTASENCTFIKLIDVHIHGYYKSFLDTYEKEIPTVSRNVIQFIMDLIFRHLFMRNYNDFKKIIEKVAEIY